MPTRVGQRGRKAGVTLVEFLFTVAIGAIVLGAMVSFSLYTGRGFAGVMNYVELEGQSRSALDRMIREIRQTVMLASYQSNRLAFVDQDTKPLVYEYSPDKRVLTRTKDGRTQTLLNGCDELNFTVFLRNPISGSFDQYPVAVATNTKVVQVSWVCSRSIVGSKINTESVQTAKIVIRNR